MPFRTVAALLVAVALVSVASRYAYSDDEAKRVKLAKLMRLTGLDRTIEKKQASCKKQAEAVREQTMEQLKGTFPDEHSRFWKEFDEAYDRFIEASKPSWTIQEAVDRYAELYGASVTEEELDRILEFYKSPIGKKAIAASQAAAPKWTEFRMAQQQEVFQKTYRTFLADLSRIARENAPPANESSPVPEDPGA